MKRLRILCLHGFQQDAMKFRRKTGSLRKALKVQVEFFYVDAPHLLNDDNEEANEDGYGSNTQNPIKKRAWFLPEENHLSTSQLPSQFGEQLNIHKNETGRREEVQHKPNLSKSHLHENWKTLAAIR